MHAESRAFKIAPGISAGEGAPLFLIAGPCVIESEAHALMMADHLADIAQRYEIPLIFKASFDKANRTSLNSYRGPGLKRGLAILESVKHRTGLPILSDIHEPGQAAPAAEVLDIIQIPAFLSRQTDLIVAAAATGRTINLKKGQFVAPPDMQYALEKARSAGASNVLLTERGTAFGYHDLVVDFRSFAWMRELGAPVIFDATHSVQRPSAATGKSGGSPLFVQPLARAAVAFGIDGLFLEVHDSPEKALSDASCMIDLNELEELLTGLTTRKRNP